MNKPLCVIVGFGFGVGLGVARAFGQAGFQLGLISRNPAKYADVLKDLAASGIDVTIVAADVRDEQALETAIATLMQTHGTPEVLVYNVVSGHYGQPTTLNAETMIQDFKANVVGGLIATKTVLPEMQAQSKGCILFTGGGWAHYPWDGAASMSIGKAGIRSLALTLAQELQETPIRIGLVSIMGQVAPGTAFDPEKIGAAFLAQHQQPVAGYETEFMFQG